MNNLDLPHNRTVILRAACISRVKYCKPLKNRRPDAKCKKIAFLLNVTEMLLPQG